MKARVTTAHGVLLFDKPQGLSSNAALQRVRKLYGWPKAGHTGTLDPLATGLLPVCFGEATKYSNAMLDADKVYLATIRLGFTSSTGDAEGEIRVTGVPDYDADKLQQVLGAFTGRIQQIPPMHSALKRAGRPLYEYARAGEEVVREPRQVTIRSLEVLEEDLEGGRLRLRVDCSKGTYVRVLAEDIGRALGCGGYLLELRRVSTGNLDISQAIGPDELEKLAPEVRISRLLPVDCLLNELPALNLDAEAAKRVSCGLTAAIVGDPVSGPARLYDGGGRFIGLGLVESGGLVVPKRMMGPLGPPPGRS